VKEKFSMSVNPIPAGFHTLAPNIIVKNVDAAVSFYRRAFGAEEISRLSMPDGKVVHCELKVGDSRLNLGGVRVGLVASLRMSDKCRSSSSLVRHSIYFSNRGTYPLY
jgi:hypothetical protein